MALEFRFYEPSQAGDLIAWLSSEPWPFHGQPNPSPEQVRSRIEGGDFEGEDVCTVWITRAEGERVGLLVIQELTDPTPIFDLRIRAAHRRKGVATSTLDWLARHLFERVGKHRVEGQLSYPG